MKKHKGIFIMVDGIDGSGKGTIVQGLGAWMRKKGKRILDLRSYMKRRHSLPEPEALKPYDVILSAEPTFSLIGRAIREEIVRDNKREYSALATAQAFALDRFILYKRVIIPALLQGKSIFQERGISSSIAYQPIQKERLSLQAILSLEGNKLALRYRPDILLITTVDPREAAHRLTKRDGKKDNAIFEHLTFLARLKKRYEAPWFRSIFMKRGTIVRYIDASTPKPETIRQAINVLSKSS